MKNHLRTLIDGRVAYSPEGDGGAPAVVDPVAKAADTTFPDDKAKPADIEPAKAEPAKDDPAKSAADDAAKKEAAKATRKAELEKMSPEDRAKAEAEDKAKEDADAWAATVPADGKYAPKMPEGIELDTAALEAFAPAFAEAKMSNGAVQKLVDKYIEHQESAQKARSEEWAKTRAGWLEAAKSDTDIGGAKWDGTVANVNRAMTKFGSDALKQYLNETGGGDHPELIRFAAKAGAAISEDRPSPGGAVKPEEAPENILFSSDKKGT